MNRRILIFPAIALAALMAPLSFAQVSGSGSSSTTQTPPTAAQMVADRVAFLTKLLDLTSAQQAQATTIFTSEQTALESTKTNMDAAQTALQAAVKANSSAGISAAAGTIGSLTTQQIVATAGADAAFYAILTASQQTKYDSLRMAGVGGPQGGPKGGPQGGPQGPPPAKQ